jgi:hypothetical protein
MVEPMRPIRQRHRSQPITSPDTQPLGALENLRKERLSQVAFTRVLLLHENVMG